MKIRRAVSRAIAASKAVTIYSQRIAFPDSTARRSSRESHALLVTSVLISNALSDVMSPYAGFTVRQIHTLAAYWVLVIVSIHLGLRWPILMSVARKLTGISQPNAIRALVLRVIAFVIALYGVWSSFELAIGTKLSMQMTLDWWNFEESVVGFFIHCIAIVGLYISLTYYAMKWLQQSKHKSTSTAPIPEKVRQ